MSTLKVLARTKIIKLMTLAGRIFGLDTGYILFYAHIYFSFILKQEIESETETEYEMTKFCSLF